MSKRIQGLVIVCIVLTMSLCPFLYVSADNDRYIPAFDGINNINMNYADIFYITYDDALSSSNVPSWVVIYRNEYIDTNQYNNVSCYLDGIYLHLTSYVSITEYYYNSLGNLTSRTLGAFDSNLNMFYGKVKLRSNSVVYASTPQRYLGLYLASAREQGMINPSSSNNSYYRTAIVPSTTEQIIDSFSTDVENQFDLMENYFQSITEEISELRSVVDAQGGEYQSALYQAQSEIESNAQSAAQSAADDIVNAGEDVSDIDDDMSDVNDIVDTLDGWIEDLDAFADTIDDTADEVADALDYADDFLSGFLSACPAIVIALFSFALVFLIVRKIIGR